MSDLRPSHVISVDVETDEVDFRKLQLLSIGATPVDDLSQRFYIELAAVKPSYFMGKKNVGALKVNHQGMSWCKTDPIPFEEGTAEWCEEFYRRTRTYGVLPLDAMIAFTRWVEEVTPEGHRAVMLSGPASFDTPIVTSWFTLAGLRMPFHMAGMCLKTLIWEALGAESWESQTTRHLPTFLTGGLTNELAHNALEDAVFQAKLYNRVRSILDAKRIVRAPETPARA